MSEKTLFPYDILRNRSTLSTLSHPITSSDTPPLLSFLFSSCVLFSPTQTSGGLLAAVPAHEAEGLILALHAAGYESAAVIGKVVRRETEGILVTLTE
jgi:AIR synthase related protein, C-terminal domain